MTVASGKPMQLRATWDGTPPAIGDYLMSTLKPRHAYRIVSVSRRSKSRLELEVARMPAADVPEGARVHAWQWDARGKARQAWSRA